MAISSKKDSGCLGTMFPFLNNAKGRVENEPLPYRVRDDFLSYAELSFYKVLQKIIGENFVIQSKVRLADIFFVINPNQNFKYYNKIIQRHLDFLICKSDTLQPIFGVELDDASHKRKKQQEKDRFLDQVFEISGLTLLREPVQRAYNVREIEILINSLIQIDRSIEMPSKVIKNFQNNTEAPFCPKCGVPMILRTVQKGEKKGNQFFGCANFPKCREVISVLEWGIEN
ncbi:MAG: DUF2726 domain-containing protein [Anaerolineaceae bacterium]|nr:DUF2726 domain-containing protein [Anaerolineaceae bacterium]